MEDEIENIEQPAVEYSGISFEVDANSNETPAIQEPIAEAIPEEVQEQEIEEQKIVVEDEDEEILVEFTEDIAFKLLKDKRGLTQETFDELLTPKEQKKYAPEMEKFNEFIEKTGNKNFNDYLETQKDWSEVSQEDKLRSYLKLSNPELSDKQVNRLYEKNYSTDGLDEEDDEDDILDREINAKTDLKKANEFFEKRKEEFKAVGGSDEYIPLEYREAKTLLESQKKQEEDYLIQRDSVRNDFISKTDSLLSNDFKGFEVRYGNEKDGFVDVVVKPEDIKEMREFQSDSVNLIKPYLDEETGALKDPKGYHLAIYMARNYEAELHKARMAGRAEQLDINDKLSKNIQPDNLRNVPNPDTGGIVFSKE